MNGESEFFQVIMGLCLGLGLSAACGFRIFVPMLFLAIGSRAGHIPLAPGFEWIGSVPAIIAFATATGLEIGAYYVPWIDNLLDSVATPAAVVAGSVVTASCLGGDMSPVLRWGLAIIAGGGTAGVVQGATVATRLLSAGVTGGLGNPVVSTAEAGASFFLALIAVLVPIAAAVVVVMLMVWVIRTLVRWMASRRETPPPETVTVA